MSPVITLHASVPNALTIRRPHRRRRGRGIRYDWALTRRHHPDPDLFPWPLTTNPDPEHWPSPGAQLRLRVWARHHLPRRDGARPQGQARARGEGAHGTLPLPLALTPTPTLTLTLTLTFPNPNPDLKPNPNPNPTPNPKPNPTPNPTPHQVEELMRQKDEEANDFTRQELPNPTP